MSEPAALPFQSFSFTLIEDRRPRASFRMAVREDGMYELHVQKGSAANPVSEFTRALPAESAQCLKDALQAIGVFSWDESYGDAPGRASMRWSVNTVFKEGVFSIASKGGSELPAGFGDMLEELYRLDFPRPAAAGSARAGGSGGVGSVLGAAGVRGIGSLSAGDLGAYGATGASPAFGGADFSQLADVLKGGAFPGADAGDLSRLLSEAGSDPQALQQRMRDEFAHMPPDEQSDLLDSLTALGFASRAWWERFLRGM